jgi:hypothetical protein
VCRMPAGKYLPRLGQDLDHSRNSQERPSVSGLPVQVGTFKSK